MRNLLLFAALLLQLSLSAQAFEGIVKMKQTDAAGTESFITWYIKDSKIAFDILVQKPNAEKMDLRFVPDLQRKVLVMTDAKTKSNFDIPLNMIQADPNIQAGIKVTELGRGNIEPSFKQNVDLEIKTANTTTLSEYTTDILIDWSLYADFFKQDYTIIALAQSKTKGFPYKSITKDAKGNVTNKLELLEVKKTSVPANVFK